MEQQLPLSRTLFWLLLAFAATAVASIALQNILIWPTVLLFLGAHFKSRLKIQWPTGIFPWATVLFVLTFFLGAVVGINPANSYHTVHKYLTFLLIFPLGAMALNLQENRKLLLAFVYGAAFCAIYGISKHFFLHEDRIDSFSGDKMVFGGMLMVALLFLAFFLAENPRDWRHWLLLPLLGVALVLTETRGAWMGLVVGFVIWAWRVNKKWLLAGLLVVAVIPFFLPASLQQRVTSIGHIWVHYGPDGQIQSASNERIFIWDSGWRIIKDHPWGIGQGNMGDIFPKYYNPHATEWIIPHLHNNFLQILAQNGWIGLAAYLFWIGAYFVAALRFHRDRVDGRDLNWVLLCAFSAVLVWGLTEYTFSHQFMNVQFFLLGLQVGLWRPRSVL